MTSGDPAEPIDSAAIASAVERLDNAVVRWDGTLAGLIPSLVSDSARRLLAAGDAAIPALVEALQDESRFVPAHVLLTQLSGVEHGTSPWNGLEVDLGADARVAIDPRQRFDLARRWHAWQQSSPRPRWLPE